MARWRNFHIIFCAVVMATQSRRQGISFMGLLGHPYGRSPTNSRHSDKTSRIVSSCFPHRQHEVVADHPCRAWSDRRSVYSALARQICRPCK
ncbi:hypothetical protein PoB_004534200 [Plakobranchus ocellatus]|uniref:Secreted protein n=1 Tax=Plakobranchus ocellatus TaxID=259542 RepID=A0AAV4BHR5_9GAST|nr:hypothetical protein PoB_004534200 [Plakobranchus ocellatus]